MLIFLLIFLTQAVSPNGNAGNLGDENPFNLTVDEITSHTVQVSWSCKSQKLYDKYEVTLQPFQATYKIVETVPHNTCYLGMENLLPDTDYRISVTSIAGRVRRRSTSIFFRTPMEDSTEGSREDVGVGEDDGADGIRSTAGLKFPHVRLVEISLVAMALVLWAGAIVLFFHRWGKIRMLLPYQPPYNKMKQNGSSTCTNCSMTPHHQCSRLQQLQLATDYGPSMGTAAAAVGVGATGLGLGLGLVSCMETGCSPMRQRLNSVAVSQAEIPVGMRIYRKALSCDHLPISDRFWYDDTDLSDAASPQKSHHDEHDDADDDDDDSVEYALLKNDPV